MKSKYKKSLKATMIAAASLVLATSAFAASIDGTVMVRVGGKVQSVDANMHRVTVINAQGATESFQVGASVSDLNKLRTGTNVVGTTARPVRLTVLEWSRLAAVPSQNGNETIAQVTSVDSQRGSLTLKDTLGAELTVQANSPGSVAAVAPGTRVLVNAVNPALLANGQALQ